jgi:hypothetical protein
MAEVYEFEVENLCGSSHIKAGDNSDPIAPGKKRSIKLNVPAKVIRLHEHDSKLKYVWWQPVDTNLPAVKVSGIPPGELIVEITRRTDRPPYGDKDNVTIGDIEPDIR